VQNGIFFLREKGKEYISRLVSLQKALFQRNYMSVVHQLEGYKDFIFKQKINHNSSEHKFIEKVRSSLELLKKKMGHMF